MQILIGGVRMHCGNKCMIQSAKFFDNCNHRCGIVGCTTGVRNDFIVFIDNVFVYTKNNGFDTIICGWNGKNDFFCSVRSEQHTSELQSRENLVCRLLLEKKKTS